MSRTLIVRPQAETDIEAAAQWYEREREGLGQEYLEEIERVLSRIQSRPLEGRAVFENIRRVLTKRFPYAVFYVASGNDVSVIAVLHQARDPDVWRSRR